MRRRFLVRRLLHAAVLLLLASLTVFLLIHLAPGDPARLMLGELASEEDVGRLRSSLGLDRPLPVQYGNYLMDLFRGDLGTSIVTRRSVSSMVVQALTPTLQLAGSALLVGVGVGLPLGLVAGFRRNSRLDKSLLGIALLGQSVPSYWLGMMLISVVALQLGILSTSGYGTVGHIILPTIALAPLIVGLTIRITRAAVIDTLHEDYVRTGHAKGLSPAVIARKHVLRNSLIPIVTVLALQTGALLGGAVITEVVFAWPGMGQLALNALVTRDYPVVQGVVLMAAVVFIVINLLVDVVYMLIDPRITYA